MYGDDRPFAEEGYAVMGAAFEVHRAIGGGLLEAVYQHALEIEFELRSIPFFPKAPLKVFYKERLLRTTYVPDFLVWSRIVVEIKAVSAVCPEHEAQLLNYMRIARIPVGYLINFGPISKLQWKRFIQSEFLSK